MFGGVQGVSVSTRSSSGIRDKVAIVGMGCTRFGERYEAGIDDLVVAAGHDAARSAGVDIAEVEAFWFGTRQSGVGGDSLAQALRLRNRPVTRVENRCATGSEALRAAVYAVACGEYDIAMAVGGEKLKDSGASGLLGYGLPSDGTVVDFTGPGAFSLLAEPYSRKYGLDPDVVRAAMTHVSWKNHVNGARNLRAHFRSEVSKEAIEKAVKVAGPLGLFDCSGVSDGAAAAIVVPAERALEFTDRPLYIKSFGLVAGNHAGQSASGFDYANFPEVVESASIAYRRAGITDPGSELAMAEVHDCFTITEVVLMEDLGLSRPGGACRDIVQGRFDIGGELPVNPDGGLTAFGHPVGASGLRMYFECWLQLRGESPPDRQISTDRSLALVQNLGGQPGAVVSFVGIVGTQAS